MNSKVTYHQQPSYCGKTRCKKCREGVGHGPYWYAYKTENLVSFVSNAAMLLYNGRLLPILPGRNASCVHCSLSLSVLLVGE